VRNNVDQTLPFPSLPFPSDAALLTYASWFVSDRVEVFRKDLAICMTPNNKGQHAYFPALITCIAFLEFLSGLYAGKLEFQKLSDLQTYVEKFFRNKTDYAHLDILYFMFRHKIAHIAYPYLIFDTTTKSLPPPARRIVWTVGILARKPAIQLIDYPTLQTKIKTKTPWLISYTSRMRVSLTALRVDIIKSIFGPSGYLQHLKTDSTARTHFAQCMKTYIPP
jgi:hypothetical protein